MEGTLAFCPHGYPNHGLLRDVLAGLDVSYNIRSPQVPTFKSRSDWANDAADATRLATKHVVDLMESGTTYLPPTLQSLVKTITVDEPATFASLLPLSWAELLGSSSHVGSAAAASATGDSSAPAICSRQLC